MAKKPGQIGEDLFKEFCQFQFWECKKIPRDAVRTPDYKVSTPKGIFVSEVSIVDIKMELGKCHTFTVGDAVRHKIKKKIQQIRNSEHPTLLTLCGSSSHLRYEDITAAMYGDLTLSIGVESGKILDSYHGKNSKLGENIYDEISAIAFLTRTLIRPEEIFEKTPETIPYMTIYHNMYARNPFSKEFFPNTIEQFWFELNKEAA